mmetsp:Transcript_13521/g.23971  ORF Transcript_13521/g.23971 Transcript_13521/m.23971 type:complete len:612 (+) Transcript_13521:120-1955(+)
MEAIKESDKEMSAAKHDMFLERASLASSIGSSIISEHSPVHKVSTRVSSKKDYRVKQRQKEKRLKKAQEQKKLEKDFEEKRKKDRLWAFLEMNKQLVDLGMDPDDGEQDSSKHPVCHGYQMAKVSAAWDPGKRAPFFFGYAHVRGRQLGGGGALAAIRSIKESTFGFDQLKLAREEEEALPEATRQQRHAEYGGVKPQHWDIYPAAPVNKGLVRQHLKQFGRQYDRQRVVHPAFFGLMVAPESHDPASLHPIFFGYSMQQTENANETFVAAVRQDFVPPLSSFPNGECPICVIGKPGCARCWDLPGNGEFEPEDWAYAGQNIEPDRAVKPGLPELHTNLTTTLGLVRWRTVHSNFVTLLMKTIPAGPTVNIVVESGSPVFFLAHLFRANSRHGTENHAFFYLPTDQGFYNIDNRFLPETDVRLGIYTSDLPIARYSLKKNGSVATILHFTYTNEHTTCQNIKEFLRANIAHAITLDQQILHYLDGIAPEIHGVPGSDIVQKELYRMLNDAEQLAAKILTQDKKHEKEKVQHLLREKYDLEKEKFKENASRRRKEKNLMMEQNRLTRRREKIENELRKQEEASLERKKKFADANMRLKLMIPKKKQESRELF